MPSSIARLKAEVRQLRAMIQQLVFLNRDGHVRWSWQDGLDLADKVPGLRAIAQPVTKRDRCRGRSDRGTAMAGRQGAGREGVSP